MEWNRYAALARISGMSMIKRDIEIAKLIAPPSRPFVDPVKLQRHGAFDWNKYTPIVVETDGASYWLMDGLTRVENARRSGLDSLPAYIFRRR
jgi:hypothetical protein